MTKDFYTTKELAEILGTSRITIFRKIKIGQIKAIKVGRNFAIGKKEIENILGKSLTENQRNEIEKGIKKTIKEYGETLRLLGKE